MWDKIEQLVQHSVHPLNGLVEPPSHEGSIKYYRFLYHLVRWRRPKLAVEIGIEIARGSYYMTLAAKEYGGQVIGIDIQNTIDGLYPPLKKYYHFLGMDSTTPATERALNKLIKKYGPIGVVFQDSSHHYYASQKEWNTIYPLLDENAIWVCDDITPAFHDPLVDPPNTSMVTYFKERPGDKRLYPDVLHWGSVIGIVLPKGSNYGG